MRIYLNKDKVSTDGLVSLIKTFEYAAYVSIYSIVGNTIDCPH